MDEKLSKFERLQLAINSIGEVDRETAALEMRTLYRLPSFIFLLRLIGAKQAELNQLNTYDLTSEDGIRRALRNQGIIEGLGAIFEFVSELAIPGDDDAG